MSSSVRAGNPDAGLGSTRSKLAPKAMLLGAGIEGPRALREQGRDYALGGIPAAAEWNMPEVGEGVLG